MVENRIKVSQILGFFILWLMYAFFLFFFTGFTLYSNGFTGLALLLAIFSALIFKSKTNFFKIVNIVFFIFTFYKLISYKMDWDTLNHLKRLGCIDENMVLKDLKEQGIIGNWEYQYSEDEEKCLLKEVDIRAEKNGVTNG